MVYGGTDSVTGLRVAVKILPTGDPGSIARVAREIAALQLLNIPGVVRMLESGGDERDTWIVMERIDGEPFPAGRRTWDAIRPLVATLLDTLARVHDLGLLHRDIKPGNVFVDTLGRPILLDFGLVRGTLAGPTITHAGAVMGTPLYMPPEQIKGDRADRRSDLYALGAMVREALTGHVPFHSEHIGSLFEARLRSDPPTIESLLPGLTPEVVTLLDALVARRPESRPKSARAALAMLGGGEGREPLPWIGDRAAVVALVEAARGRRSATVAGPRGSGRTRTLREAARALADGGATVRWIGPAADPLGSLRGLLGEPSGDDPNPLATMEARLRAAQDAGDIVFVDDWDGVDPFSRALLGAREGVIASTVAGGPGPARSMPPASGAEPRLHIVATLRPFTEAELVAIFAGPERLLHLPSDGAALLLRRTGGLAARVVSELQRWLDADLATVRSGADGLKVRVTRANLDRIAAGFAGPPVADVVEAPLPQDLDDLLAWVHLASPGCTVQRLAAARNEPGWRVDLAVRQLEGLGAVARSGPPDAVIIEPIRPADALMSWQNDVRLAAHGALARTLAPGTAGRMYHLVALGDGPSAVVDAVALGSRLAEDGRLAEALAALTEAARLALSTGVSATALWTRLATLAIQDGTRPALASAADLLQRSDADPALVDVV